MQRKFYCWQTCLSALAHEKDLFFGKNNSIFTFGFFRSVSIVEILSRWPLDNSGWKCSKKKHGKYLLALNEIYKGRFTTKQFFSDTACYICY